MSPPFTFCAGIGDLALVILEKKVAGLSRDTLARFVLRARRAAGVRGSVSVLVTGSTAVRALNRQFRGKNKATDVLSFPCAPSGASREGNASAGDIAISADIARQQAVRLGHSQAEEIRILTLHGILHLAGFDHERDNGEMARREAKLRRTLGLPASLIERVTAERMASERVKIKRVQRGQKRPHAAPARRRA